MLFKMKTKVISIVLLLVCFVYGIFSEEWVTVPVGKGAYTLTPSGTQTWDWKPDEPRKDHLPQEAIYKTGNLTGPTPTNDWASSILWNVYSDPIYGHPLSYKFTGQGLEISNPPLTIKEDVFYNQTTKTLGPGDGEDEASRLHTAETMDFIIKGSGGFNAPDARADKITDWTYDVVLESGGSSIKATIGHGMPFVFFEFNGTSPVLQLNSSYKTMTRAGGSTNAVMIEVKDKTGDHKSYYGLYAPAGGTITVGSGQVSIDLAGNTYFTLALLPDSLQKTLDFYKKYAYNFITGTQADYSYSEETGLVSTDFIVEVDKKAESAAEGTLFALYPHQWRDNDLISPVPSFEYESIRGKMKVVEGTSFTTAYAYRGILPWMPGLKDKSTKDKAAGYLQAYYDYHSTTPEVPFFPPGLDGAFTGYDTYWMGKNFGRVGKILGIAEALEEEYGKEQISEDMLAALKKQLEWWFKAEERSWGYDNFFYYNENWGTLIGYPSSFFSDSQINDHHFHYGYWVYAAAQVALRDPDWAKDENWGGMVKELIMDYGNWNRDNTGRYPYLRNFDLYAGHSWASGHANFLDRGASDLTGANNQESTSEAINAWVGMILWGEATGNKAIRDAGIYMYTTEIEAINNYWFDIYGDIIPEEFSNDDAVMVWGGKYNHKTWWTEFPAEAHGINILPITTGSYYLGRNKEYVALNYKNTYLEYPNYVEKNRIHNWEPEKSEWVWQDILCSYLATADPAKALADWKEDTIYDDKANGYTPDFGDDKIHTYFWLHHLDQYGTPRFDVTANIALYQVFHKEGAVGPNGRKLSTYVAYNPTPETITAKFSGSVSFAVEPGQMAIVEAEENPDDAKPSKPENVDVTTVTTNSVTAVWSPSIDNVGVKGYYLYAENDTETKSVFVDHIENNAFVTGTVTGLKQDTVYRIYVIAEDEAGNKSDPSTPKISIRTEKDTQPPTVPGNLVCSGCTSSTISLQWEKSTDNAGVAGYTIYYKPGKASTNKADYPFKKYIEGNLDRGIVTGLEKDSEYSLLITATDGSNESDFDNVITERTKNNIPPGDPSNQTITGTTKDSISISWTASKDSDDGVKEYIIYARQLPGTDDQLNEKDEAGRTADTSYTLNGLLSETGYRIGIQAVDYSGDRSNIVELTGETDPALPYGTKYVSENSAMIFYKPETPVLIGVECHFHINNGPRQSLRMTEKNGQWEFLVSPITEGDTITGYLTVIGVAGELELPEYTHEKGPDKEAPSIPGNLTITGTTTSTISVSWSSSTDNVEVTGYEIYVDGNYNGQTSKTTTVYTAGGLEAGTAYLIEVLAKDAAGNKSDRAGETVYTKPKDVEPPTVPGNLTVTGTTTSTISVSWSSSTDNVEVTGYEVYIDGNYNGQTSKTTTVYTAGGLEAGTAYLIEVLAKDAAGNKSDRAGETAYTKPKDVEPPTVPGNLTVTGTTTSTISVSWSSSTDNVEVTGYEVYIDGNYNGQTSKTTTVYTAGGLEAGTAYLIEVLAKDAAGNKSGRAGETAYTKPKDVEPPTVPGNLTVTGTTTSTISISWSSSTDNVEVTGYEIYVDGNYNGETSKTTTVYTAGSLQSGTGYYIEVLAKDAAGNKSGRTGKTAYTESDKEYGVEALSDDSARIFYTYAENPGIGIDVHLKINNGGQLNYRMVNNSGTNEYIVTGITKGDVIDYYFTLIGVKDTEWDSYTHKPGPGEDEYGAEKVSSDSAGFFYITEKPEITSVKLALNNGGEIDMTGSNGSFEYVVTGLADGDVLSYYFKTPAGQTAPAVYTHKENTSGWGVEKLNDTSALIYYTPEEAVPMWLDVHYRINSGGQLNCRMILNNGRWEYTMQNVKSGDRVDFNFTIVGVKDTEWDSAMIP